MAMREVRIWFLASCEHVEDQLSALDEDELGVIERARIRGHLAMCRACKRVLRDLRATGRALASLRDDVA